MAISKAIIFDLGNVIFSCSVENALRYWANISGQNLKTILNKLNLEHPVHDKFERGEIKEDEFRHFISDKIDYELSRKEFQLGWNSIYSAEIPGIKKLLDELIAEYRVIGLTNTNKTHSKVWKEKYMDTLSRFEVIFSSHEIGCRKPEKKAFQICVDYLEIPVSNLIFLDDRTENIKGAIEFGIRSILVKSFNQMKEELRKTTANNV